MENMQTMATTPSPLPDAQAVSLAADMMINQNMNDVEITQALTAKGYTQEQANGVVSLLQQQIVKARKNKAQKDMLYGALWCVGGIIGTAANIGFIFWGAIVFGGIQFFMGLFNSFKDD